MKRLLIGIGIISVISACMHTKTKDPDEKKAVIGSIDKTEIRISLNGIPYTRANQMVASFRADSTSTDDATAVWFSKDWVDSVGRLLDNDHADGFRIYFAKSMTSPKKNTVVVVSTNDDGPDVGAESGNDHVDYFKHDPSFLPPRTPYEIDENSHYEGATLYANPNCDGACVFSGTNYITCQNAAKAVTNFKKTKINTRSEWFSICFFDYLRDELDKSPADVHADGIRIYFAYHDKDTNDPHKYRHAFIIVETQTAVVGTRQVPRTDNYKCYIPYNSCPVHATGDNGEQCLNNCTGATLPSN